MFQPLVCMFNFLFKWPHALLNNIQKNISSYNIYFIPGFRRNSDQTQYWISSHICHYLSYTYKCFTFLSKSLSHMSLMIHPAPLMRNAPMPNRAISLKSGKWPASPARQMLQVHGQNSSHVPEITQQGNC